MKPRILIHTAGWTFMKYGGILVISPFPLAPAYSLSPSLGYVFNLYRLISYAQCGTRSRLVGGK